MAIRTLRLETGKTQEEVARGINVALRVYTRWEAGDTKPDADNLVALLDYLRDALNRPELQARDLLTVPDPAEALVTPDLGGEA